MIELSKEQRQAVIGAEEKPPLVVDPLTRTEYVLIRADVYAQMKAVIDGHLKCAGWDDPALDVYESYRKAR